MHTYLGLDNVEAACHGAVLTMGSFDGLHLGHQSLVNQTIEMSGKFAVPPVVLTFDPHPTHILRPESAVRRLYSLKYLESQLRTMGVFGFVIEPFTRELAQTAAEDFILKVVKYIRPRAFVVGYDFVFGRARGGSVDVLRAMGEKFNFTVVKKDPLTIDGEVVSSSSIRQFIQTGDIEKAARFLGRPFSLLGKVLHGEGRGRQLGYPTLNLAASTEVQVATGVYVSRLVYENQSFFAVTNVGHRPTFHSHSPLEVETHVLDEKLDLYGKDIEVQFLRRLRSEMKFAATADLVKQIENDIYAAKKYFGI